MRLCQVGLCARLSDEGWMTCGVHRGQHWSDRFGAVVIRMPWERR